ncbi:MAG: PilZ domain-containing protein [Deltaproteobacteria bacterium]|nr:PilZ domain-containing protein [Deltaproteobacteria bacterium]
MQEEWIERRKYKRFQVPIGAFLSFGPDDSRLGEIIDISMSGLAYRYLATEEQPNRARRLNIFLTEHDSYVADVPFDTVSDFRTCDISFTPVTMRRSGVQFGELTHSQMSRLEHFIDNHALRET